MFGSKELCGVAAMCLMLGGMSVGAQTTETVQQASANAAVKYNESLKAGSLSGEDLETIITQAEKASEENASMKGLRTTDAKQRPGKFHIYVVDRQGKILIKMNQPDAWAGSIDIALGKARTASFFSSDENALTSRDIGNLTLPDGNGKAGPLWGIGNTNHFNGEDFSSDMIRKNTLVTFPGGVPLYKNGHLVGAIGVSGDGVDQDEAVAFAGAQGFLPGDDVGKISDMKAVDVEKIK